MTRNQIEYAQLLETKRSNLRNEELTGARDAATRDAKLVELQEMARHNKVGEGLTARELDLKRGSLDETARHNQMAEMIDLRKANESKRHNKATESATLIDLGEKQRHNQVTENESQRHNQEVEGETKRHNLVGEVTDAGRLTLDTVTKEQTINETKRHNLAMESKDLSPDVKVYSNVTTPTATPSQIVNIQGSDKASQQSAATKREPDPPKSYDIGHYRMMNGQLYYAYNLSPHIGAWGKVVEKAGANYYQRRDGKLVRIP